MIPWFTALGLGIKVAIIATIIAAIVGAGWAIHHIIYMSGFRAAEAKLQPQIDKLKGTLKNTQDDLTTTVAANETLSKELGRVNEVVRGQNAKVLALEAASIEAQNKAREALAKAKTATLNNAAAQAKIKELEAILNGPTLSEGDCEQTDAILRSLYRDLRMPDSSGATPGGSAAPAR